MLLSVKSRMLQFAWGIFIILLLSCEKESLSPAQAESFFKLFGNYQNDTGYDVKALPDGGYVVVGSTTTDTNDKDIIIIRTDKFGNEIWKSMKFGELSDDIGYSIQLLNDGGFIILGSTSKPGQSTTNMCLIRTNSEGDIQWTKEYGGIYNEVGYDVKNTNDGGFILIGSTESFGQGGKDVWIIKTTAQGDSIWTRTHGGINDDVGKCIIETEYGYILTGYTQSYSEPGQANSNIFVIKVNTLGKEIFPFTYGGLEDDFGESIVALPDGGYIVAATLKNTQTNSSNVMLFKIEEQISQISWAKMFGGNVNHFVSSLKITPDNGFILTGTTELSSANHNIFLLKTDSQGNQQFFNTYGGAGLQRAESVDIALDEGFIITGSNEFEGNSMITLIKTKSDGGL